MSHFIRILAVIFCLWLSSGVLQAESSQTHEGIEITVNINTASAEEISSLLLGVGPAKARAIVEYRDEQGPFTSKEQLQQVKGIGAVTVERNADRIIL